MLACIGRHEEAFRIFDQGLARWPDHFLMTMQALRTASEVRDWPRYDALRARIHPSLTNNWMIGEFMATSFIRQSHGNPSLSHLCK